MAEDDPTLRHAHFLHRPKLLEALFAPQVPQARLLRWAPNGTLWLASQAGTIYQVQTDGGTRRIFEGPVEPVAMTGTADMVVVATRNGEVSGWALGRKFWTLTTGILAQVAIYAYAGGWVISGDNAEGERVALLLTEDGILRLRTVLPERTVVGVREDGSLFVGRSLESGFFCKDFGYQVPDGPVTSHTLRSLDGGRMMGFSQTGVLFWDGEARSIRLPNVVNAAWGRHRVALGRRNGAVMVTDLAPQARRAEVAGHTGSILGMGFSPDGKLLATTAADGCRVWSIS